MVIHIIAFPIMAEDFWLKTALSKLRIKTPKALFWPVIFRCATPRYLFGTAKNVRLPSIAFRFRQPNQIKEIFSPVLSAIRKDLLSVSRIHDLTIFI